MRKPIFLVLFIIMFIYLLLLSDTFNITSSEANNNDYEVNDFNRLNTEVAISTPAFSPNGKQIIFLSNKFLPETGSIWIMNYTGENKSMIYVNSTIDYDFSPPVFSPDGKKIIYSEQWWGIDRDHHSIDILKKNGTTWVNPIKHEKIIISVYKMIPHEKEGKPEYPSYNVDGKKILFRIYGGDSDLGAIWVMDSDGSNRTRLTFTERGCKKPRYNSDSTKIVYLKYSEGGNHELWIMNNDGSDQKKLLSDNWYPDNPSFTPDGRILFESAKVSPHSDKIAAGNVWMMDPDGKNKVIIVPSSFNNEIGSTYPTINPNGTIIVFEHGLTDDDLYSVFDPTSKWKDSDGDGVWDGIDGAPNDPNAGYIKDDDHIDGISSCWSFLVVIIVVVCLLISVVKIKSKD